MKDHKMSSSKEKIFVKSLVVIIGILIYLLIKDNKFHSSIIKGNKFDLALDLMFENVTYYLSQNLVYRNFAIIYSGLWLDTLFIIFLTLYVYRGTGYRELLAFATFYGLRALFMAVFDFDYPKADLHEDPGFFSLVSPHGRSPDFFYSGHTGFSFLCTLFILKYKHFYLFLLGIFVTLIQIFAILIIRFHYVIDAYVGLIASHYFYMISPKLGKIFNRIIPILND